MPDSQTEVISSPYGFQITLHRTLIDNTHQPVQQTHATVVATIPLSGGVDLEATMDEVRHSVDRLLLNRLQDSTSQEDIS